MLDRAEKLKRIRACFADQGIKLSNGKSSGWNKEEVAKFFKLEFGIDFKSADSLTGEQVDAVYENLDRAKML